MIRFFRSTHPATLFIIPAIVLIFWWPSILQLPLYNTDESLPLWNGVRNFFSVFPSWANFIILFALLCVEAIYLNYVVNKNEVLYKNSYLPALIFVLFVSATPGLMILHPVYFINLLMIRILDRLFTLFKNELPVSALFDSGFLAGVAALLYFPAVVFLLLLICSVLVLRPFRIKDLLIILIGFFLPYFFLSVYLFWNVEFIGFWSLYLGKFGNIHPQFSIEINTSFIVLISYFVVLLILSLFKLKINYRKNVIRSRSYQQIFFIFLMLAGAGLLFTLKIRVIDFVLLAIPFAVFVAYYFVSAKNRIWFYEYLFWGLVGVMIWNHFIH